LPQPFPLGNPLDRERDRTSSSIIPVTIDPNKSLTDNSLFIPFPRTGEAKTRKKPNPEVPNPNFCKIPDKDCSNPPPTFVEDKSLPEHYTLVATAINRDHKPTYLTRVDSEVNKNNRRFTSIYYNKKYGNASQYSRFGSEAEWDEYPYSSTLQGGFGATLGSIKASENFTAGLKLNNFYNTKKVLPGCSFLVVLG
jgi:hypothetical protein